LTIVASYLHHPDVSKAIRYDSLLIRALARELDERYAGRGVRAIRITAAARTLAIVGRRASLIWNIGTEDGFLVEQAERGRRSGVILPRDTRTVSVRARPDDRTIHWVLETPGEAEERRRFEVWVELLPSRRAAAVTAEGRVLASMGPVAGPGARYEPPATAVRGGTAETLSFEAFAE
jgi:hypothetical protein